MTLSPINSSDTKPYAHPSSDSPFKSFSPARVIPESRGKFIYTLVHEIRNPLANIDLAIEVLKRIVRDENQEIYLDIITRNSARIKDMVADLLTSQNTNTMKPETHSVQYLLEEVLLMNEDRIMLKGVTVRKNYATQDFKKEFDRPKLKIALTNIIINAIEAMPANNAQLEITTKLLQGVCFIIIKDNGTGISHENLNTLFKPYITHKPGGMGLGLSGTLAILNSNHIGIHVRSEVEKGTRFILSFKQEAYH